MAKLNIVIDILANDRASGPLGRITSAMQGFGSGVQQAGRLALGVAGGAMTALGAGFLYAGRTAIDMNSVLETSTLQFETLMGDATRAEEHVRSLFDFAKSTPFETGPIIEASRMLQTFGGDALNTHDNLTLIGDAAAASNAPIEDLGFWVGRLYSNLQTGQPFGEAAMRLQELAVLTPEARQEMQALQEAGASADEIFAVFQENLGRFDGAMEKQAGTWEGLKSTISDALSITAAQAFAPFFEMAKSGLGSLVEFLESPALTAGVTAFAGKLESVGMVVGLFIDHIRGGMQPLDAFGAFITQMAIVFGMAAPDARELGSSIVDFVASVQSALEPVTDFVSSHVELSDVLIALGIAVGSVVIPAVISLAASVAAVAAPIALVIGAVAALRTAWETDFGGIRDFAAGVWQGIQTGWEAFRQLFEGDWDGFLTTIDEAWRTAWDATITFLGNLWSMAEPYVSEWWNAFVTWFQSQDWRQLALTAIERIAYGLQSFWLYAKSHVEQWFVSLMQWSEGADWASIGRSLVQGIAGGIAAAASFIRDAIQASLDGAIAATKDHMGIKSPSRVTAEIIGRPLAQGVGVGWQRELRGLNMAQPLMAAMPAVAAPSGGGTQQSIVFDFRGAQFGSGAPVDIENAIERVLARHGINAQSRSRI